VRGVPEARGGVLVVDKPAGMTSHDVVHGVRRALGGVRVGHTGTLDPFATGVLPLVVGRATRLAPYYSGAGKVYLATIRLGWATTTYDHTGETTWQGPASEPRPAADAIARAVADFVGAHDQIPPPFSAKKAGGVPAYERARRGEDVVLRPVRVTAHAIDLVAVEADLVTLRIDCSAGYYVRSLAHDLGRALGTGGHLAALRRTRSGPFDLEAAVGLEPVLRDPSSAWPRLIPVDALLTDLPAVVLTAEGVAWVQHGRAIGPAQTAGLPPGAWPAKARLLGPDGRLWAVAEPAAGGVLHPGLVLG
jgi:tRNA pseudouridine55 synthase